MGDRRELSRSSPASVWIQSSTITIDSSFGAAAIQLLLGISLRRMSASILLQTKPLSLLKIPLVAYKVRILSKPSTRCVAEPWILGLGATAEGLFGALIDQGLPCKSKFQGMVLQASYITPSALYSLYLTPRSVGNAEITFGGVRKCKFTGTASKFEVLWQSRSFLSGDLIYSPLSDGAARVWVLDSPGISVNGQTTSL